jgi:hypothetical protein
MIYRREKLNGELLAEPESALRVSWANWHKDFSDKQASPLRVLASLILPTDFDEQTICAAFI